DRAHPLRVLARERIPLVHRLRQRPDRLREHLAHLDEPLIRDACRREGQTKEQCRPPAGPRELVHPGHQPSEGCEGKEVCPDTGRLSTSEKLSDWSPSSEEHD